MDRSFRLINSSPSHLPKGLCLRSEVGSSDDIKRLWPLQSTAAHARGSLGSREQMKGHSLHDSITLTDTAWGRDRTQESAIQKQTTWQSRLTIQDQQNRYYDLKTIESDLSGVHFYFLKGIWENPFLLWSIPPILNLGGCIWTRNQIFLKWYLSN